MATFRETIYKAAPKTIQNMLPPNWGIPPGRMTVEEQKKRLSGYIAPVQLQRFRQDIQTWRDGVVEAENAWYPHRVKMQRLFIDTILNGHVAMCMEKRRDLTLMREFAITQNGEANEELGEMFRHPWFRKFLTYVLDSQAFGYSLIELGDVVNGAFPQLNVIKRHNVSPDRLNVSQFVYSIAGAQFLEEPYVDWHVWVPTPSETGVGTCGYGYLYKVAPYEILNRNLLGYNGDFVELFAQPFRVGKTMKTEGEERAMLEAALQNMGSAGWAVIDPTDEIQFLETSLGGNGYRSYADLEMRNNQHIAGIILGHRDALSATPGKLGGSQGGQESPEQLALKAKQVKDGVIIEDVVNNQLIPKMRNLGFNIPDDAKFEFLNNFEKEEIREREDESNKKVAEIAQIMHNAGLMMNAEYFTERTGIPATPVQVQIPAQSDVQSPKGYKAKIETAVNKLYK